MSPGARLLFALGLAPVPTEMSINLSVPTGQLRLYGSTVAMRKTRKAGLLYIVTAPSTIRNGAEPPASISSGGKYVGAAVLARTNCHSGRSRLRALPCARRSSRLYVAYGLFDSGH